MVIITTVYVIATVLICYFNWQSAKATRDQTNEMKAQFYAINRPIITAELVNIKRMIWAVRFRNEGSQTAFHTKIIFEQECINSIPEEQFRELLINGNEKETVIGVNQTHDIYLGSSSLKNDLTRDVEGRVIYQGIDGSIYAEDFRFNLRDYAIFYSFESDEDRLIKMHSEHNKQLVRIRKAIEELSLQIPKAMNNDE